MLTIFLSLCNYDFPRNKTHQEHKLDRHCLQGYIWSSEEHVKYTFWETKSTININSLKYKEIKLVISLGKLSQRPNGLRTKTIFSAQHKLCSDAHYSTNRPQIMVIHLQYVSKTFYPGMADRLDTNTSLKKSLLS